MYSELFVLFIPINSVLIYIYILYSVVEVTFIPVILDCYKKTRCHSTVLHKAILYLLDLQSSTNILTLHYDKN